jgi:hypothetical protein
MDSPEGLFRHVRDATDGAGCLAKRDIELTTATKQEYSPTRKGGLHQAAGRVQYAVYEGDNSSGFGQRKRAPVMGVLAEFGHVRRRPESAIQG